MLQADCSHEPQQTKGLLYQTFKICFIITSFTSLLLLWDSNVHNKLAVLYLTSFVSIFFKYVLCSLCRQDEYHQEIAILALLNDPGIAYEAMCCFSRNYSTDWLQLKASPE